MQNCQNIIQYLAFSALTKLKVEINSSKKDFFDKIGLRIIFLHHNCCFQNLVWGDPPQSPPRPCRRAQTPPAWCRPWAARAPPAGGPWPGWSSRSWRPRWCCSWAGWWSWRHSLQGETGGTSGAVLSFQRLCTSCRRNHIWKLDFSVFFH